MIYSPTPYEHWQSRTNFPGRDNANVEISSLLPTIVLFREIYQICLWSCSSACRKYSFPINNTISYSQSGPSRNPMQFEFKSRFMPILIRVVQIALEKASRNLASLKREILMIFTQLSVNFWSRSFRDSSAWTSCIALMAIICGS